MTTKQAHTLELLDEATSIASLRRKLAASEARVAELEAAARVAPSFDFQRELEIGLDAAEIEAVAGVLKRRYITGPDGRDYEAYLKAFSKLAERPTLCPFSDSREVLARVFVKA